MMGMTDMMCIMGMMGMMGMMIVMGMIGMGVCPPSGSLPV